jgi:hypothetical protein
MAARNNSRTFATDRAGNHPTSSTSCKPGSGGNRWIQSNRVWAMNHEASTVKASWCSQAHSFCA